jgi:Na+-driven multidrug efflux pump
MQHIDPSGHRIPATPREHLRRAELWATIYLTIMLQIFALGAVTYPAMVIGSAFTATGDSYISAIVSIVDAVSMVAFLAIGFLIDGLFGAVASIALHRFVPSTVILVLAKRRDWVWLRHEFRVIIAFTAGIILVD